jgi:hypothetical protein
MYIDFNLKYNLDMKQRRWTKEEEQTLIALAKGGSNVFEIAEKLNRTAMAVVIRTRQLTGLEPHDADRSLPEDYYDQTKTYSQIYKERGKPWTEEDDTLLKTRFFNGSTIEQLSKQFNRSRTAILMRLETLHKRPADMNALFDRAKLLLGKKRVVRQDVVDKKPAQSGKEEEIIGHLNDLLTYLKQKDDTEKLEEIFNLLLKGQELVLNIYKSKANGG